MNNFPESSQRDEVDRETSAEEQNINISLNRYFDNTGHTIFDEIASSQKETTTSFFDTEQDAKPTSPIEPQTPTSTSDLHRDAWIPPEQTRKVLRTIATSTPGNHNVEKESLTMPGLTIQEELVDPIRNAVVHFLGEEEALQRNSLTISDVTHDERGLRQLIQAGCLRAAINLTGRLIPLYGQGFGKMNQPSKHSPTSLQLWFTRLLLLAKIRLTEVLENESRPFGDLNQPDVFYTFYPELYGTRPGSMASFSFRLLLAEVPSYCGKPKQSLDNLFRVLAVVRRILKNLQAGLTEDGTGKAKFSMVEQEDSTRLWKGRHSRTLISIANCALTLKNYVLVTEILEQLLGSFDWSNAQEILVSATGRVHLSLGDVSAAEKRFAEGRRLGAVTENGSSAENHRRVREFVDRGLTAIAQNAFQEAYESFNAALQLDPGNVMLVNNVAVCLLYTGKLESAVHLLENAVARNPVRALQESLLLNMSTLYELHSTHNRQSKLHLLSQLNRCKGDSIDMQCLKLIT